MGRKVSMLVIGAVTIVVVSLASPAHADEACELLHVGCLVDSVVNDPDEVVEDPVDTITDTVDDTEETVDPVVDPVRDVVDDLLGGGGIVDPPTVDPPIVDDGGGRNADPRTVDGPGGSRDGEARDGSGVSVGGPTALGREAFAPPAPPQTQISAASGQRPVAPSAPGRLEGFIEGAMRGLLLVLVLFGITVGFVLLQDRLDRNDPKLAIAPIRPDVVAFE